MSTTYTSRLNLGKPAAADRGWGTTANATFDAIESLNPIGALNVAAKETPSSTLNVRVAAGAYEKADGTIGSYAGTSSQAIAASSTKVVYLDASGALTVGASYPAAPHTRLATVVAGASTITSVADDRVAVTTLLTFLPLAGGTLADAADVALGTTTGTKIGTSSSQKLGFLGATPVVQQTFGAATAGASYTATEQAMLQKVYNALRTFGFGS